MSLTRKLLVYIAFIFFVTLTSIFLISQFVLEKRFEILETDSVISNLTRIRAAIDDRVQNIDIIAADYAGWDDAYTYVQTADKAYEESNLTSDSFNGIKMNLHAYINNQGQTVYIGAYDLKTHTMIPIPTGFNAFLTPDSPLLSHSDTSSKKAGLINIPQGVVIISSRPILTSQRTGPIMGTLVMGRFLDSDMTSAITTSTQVPFEIITLKTSNLPQELTDKLKKGETYVNRISNKEVQGFMPIPDVFNNNEMAIKVTLPRTIYAQGEQTINTLLLILMVIGFLSLVLGSIVTNKILIGPLNDLIYDLNILKKTGDTSLRVRVAGKDEISFVAKEINGLLGVLSKGSKK